MLASTHELFFVMGAKKEATRHLLRAPFPGRPPRKQEQQQAAIPDQRRLRLIFFSKKIEDALR